VASPTKPELQIFFRPVLETVMKFRRYFDDVAYRTLLGRAKEPDTEAPTAEHGRRALEDEVIKPLTALMGTAGAMVPGAGELLLTITSYLLDVDIVHMRVNIDKTRPTGTKTWAHCSVFTSRLPAPNIRAPEAPPRGRVLVETDAQRRACYTGPTDRSLHPLFVLTTRVKGHLGTVSHMSPVLVERVPEGAQPGSDHFDLATIYPPVDDSVYSHAWSRWGTTERYYLRQEDGSHVAFDTSGQPPLNGKVPIRGHVLCDEGVRAGRKGNPPAPGALFGIGGPTQGHRETLRVR
jgi:hypothetical protein